MNFPRAQHLVHGLLILRNQQGVEFEGKVTLPEPETLKWVRPYVSAEFGICRYLYCVMLLVFTTVEVSGEAGF